MVLNNMRWYTKEIYQVILGLTSRKIKRDIRNIAIKSGGEKFNHVVITLSARIKSREMPTGKPLLHEEQSIIKSKYRGLVGMLSYIRGSTRL